MMDEGNVSAKTIFRKHLRKQIYHMIKESIYSIIAVWLLGGGLIFAFALGGIVALYRKYVNGISDSNTGFVVFGIWMIFWLFTWILILFAFLLDEIWIKIKKNLRIARENTAKEVAVIERDVCPECESEIDLQTIFCAHCGIQLRKKNESTDSYVWHYSG
jgi:hypothetical protein